MPHEIGEQVSQPGTHGRRLCRSNCVGHLLERRIQPVMIRSEPVHLAIEPWRLGKHLLEHAVGPLDFLAMEAKRLADLLQGLCHVAPPLRIRHRSGSRLLEIRHGGTELAASLAGAADRVGRLHPGVV